MHNLAPLHLHHILRLVLFFHRTAFENDQILSISYVYRTVRTLYIQIFNFYLLKSQGPEVLQVDKEKHTYAQQYINANNQ